MARFEVPDGWVAQAYRFALDSTPGQARALASHAGAARFAHNHLLAVVKAVLDQRAAERSYGIAENELTPSLGWSLAALRKTWNARKNTVAPWWGENSKEAYNTGLDALARGLDAWAKSRKGARAGKAVGFPRFKSARSRRSVRFTTGTIRVEPDRHHITLPRVGTIKTQESTRKLARRLDAGTARILSAAVTRDASGRWFCSLQTLVQAKQRPSHVARSAYPVVGVDVGVKADSLLVVAAPDGAEVAQVAAPKALSAAQPRLRALQRKATTALAQQHRVICVETLNACGMRAKGGAYKRGLNRALADAALAEIRRMLAYKTRWYGSTLIEADRFYPSSKTCSACGGRKPNLPLAERTYICQHCGLVIDRDRGAAINLARLSDTHHPVGETGPADSGSVAGRGATQETDPARAGDAGGREASTPHNPTRVGQTGTAVSQGTAA